MPVIQQNNPDQNHEQPRRGTAYSAQADGCRRRSLYQSMMGCNGLPIPKSFVFTSHVPPPPGPIIIDDGSINADPQASLLGELANPVNANRVSNDQAIWPRSIRDTALRTMAYATEPELMQRNSYLNYFAKPPAD